MTRAIFTDSDEKRWFRDEPDDSDDLVPLDHPVMKEAFQKWRDAELLALSRGHREYMRGWGK